MEIKKILRQKLPKIYKELSKDLDIKSLPEEVMNAYPRGIPAEIWDEHIALLKMYAKFNKEKVNEK